MLVLSFCHQSDLINMDSIFSPLIGEEDSNQQDRCMQSRLNLHFTEQTMSHQTLTVLFNVLHNQDERDELQ